MDAMHKSWWSALMALTLLALTMPAWAAEVMVFSHRPMRSVESFTQQLQQLSKHDIAQTTQVDALAGAKLVVAVGAPSVAALAGKVSQPCAGCLHYSPTVPSVSIAIALCSVY